MVTDPNGTPSRDRALLSRVPLRDQAVEVLREMVISGEIGAGERINEAELATRLGISRGPLREAIQRLGAEGFIDFQQNRGAFVRVISQDDLKNMYEVRRLIEIKAVELAAERATASGISELENLLAAVDAALQSTSSGAYPVEFDLHELVLELSANPFLQRVGRDLQNQVRLARVKSGREPERALQALIEHQRIIAAIAARDGAAAAVAMSDHLDHSLQYSLTHAVSE